MGNVKVSSEHRRKDQRVGVCKERVLLENFTDRSQKQGLKIFDFDIKKLNLTRMLFVIATGRTRTHSNCGVVGQNA